MAHVAGRLRLLCGDLATEMPALCMTSDASMREGRCADCIQSGEVRKADQS